MGWTTVPNPELAVPNDTVDAPMLGPITSGGGADTRVVIAGSPARADAGGSTPKCDPVTNRYQLQNFCCLLVPQIENNVSLPILLSDVPIYQIKVMRSA